MKKVLKRNTLMLFNLTLTLCNALTLPYHLLFTLNFFSASQTITYSAQQFQFCSTEEMEPETNPQRQRPMSLYKSVCINNRCGRKEEMHRTVFCSYFIRISLI